jgi:hypothetical protein
MPLLEPVQRAFMHQPVPTAEEFHGGNVGALEGLSHRHFRIETVPPVLSAINGIETYFIISFTTLRF